MKTFSQEQLLCLDAIMAKWYGYPVVDNPAALDAEDWKKPTVWFDKGDSLCEPHYSLSHDDYMFEWWQPTKDIAQALDLVTRYQERHPYARFGMFPSLVEPPHVSMSMPVHIGNLSLYAYPEGANASTAGHLLVAAQTLPIAICYAIQIADQATGYEDIPEDQFLYWLAQHFTP